VLTRRPQPGDPRALIHRRFYTALILQRLVNEERLSVLEEDFGISRGELQQLMLNAGTFAGMTAIFCERLHWRYEALLVTHYKERFSFGVKPELLPLMRVPNVRNLTARRLHAAGYKTPRDIVDGGLEALVRAIARSLPFELNSQRQLAAAEATARQIFEDAEQLVRGERAAEGGGEAEGEAEGEGDADEDGAP
jgi:replicative superfamily II helicase